ncbi:PorH family porin [Corynebacterium crudilactis]|uniref:PorH family porin n=1 Tax=Corynebacterium crudilactis TaxID=1652495 RepID=UPI000B09F9B3|nr:PorH family porin [Corynebacterium crudilactis]
MDLSLLKDNLSDYATFGKNIGTALQSIPELLGSILYFFDNIGDISEATQGGFEALSN